ncbi:MAG: hypothetical protein QOF53_4155 [Nocardioidaceae bacterium]|nr:hypothetical protein [Nocardioidaceae bacterium]
MPTPPPVSRRTALGGAVVAAGLVAGCTAPGSDAPPRAAGPRREDPDVALLSAVLASEQRLLDRVVATLRRHPDLPATQSAALAGARTTHRAHVALLRAGAPSDSPSPSVSASASSTATATPVPGRAAAALLALAGAEDDQSGSVRHAALAARSGAFARVLASMAAAAAQQAVHLRAGSKDRR